MDCPACALRADREAASNNGNTDAFPAHDHNGMTLREYIASRCLQGLLSKHGCAVDESSLSYPAKLARDAVKHANALLLELERDHGTRTEASRS